MLIVLSPAKTLDFDGPLATNQFSQPDFLDDSEQLISQLKELQPTQLAELMKISPKLANLNFGRHLDWAQPFTEENARQAVLTFKGTVYTGLDATNLKKSDLRWAQDHLRILSGLYGVLRPLDLIQAYRLEMGISLSNNRGKDLYEFWGDTLTHVLNKTLKEQKKPALVNLASKEYFKVLNPHYINADVITPVFKDWKNGKYKIISFYAKKARGLMTRYIIQNRIENPEKIKQFSLDGYQYNDAMSHSKEWVFIRDEPN